MADKDKFADEVMNEDELDGVAGGTCYEMADDSRFLNSLNNSCERYGSFISFLGVGSTEVIEAWKKLGIEAKLYNIDGNKYYLNGKKITQEEARQHAMKVTGHYMTESDWKW